MRMYTLVNTTHTLVLVVALHRQYYLYRTQRCCCGGLRSVHTAGGWVGGHDKIEGRHAGKQCCITQSATHIVAHTSTYVVPTECPQSDRRVTTECHAHAKPYTRLFNPTSKIIALSAPIRDKIVFASYDIFSLRSSRSSCGPPPSPQ